jgi:hypothetical protein
MPKWVNYYKKHHLNHITHSLKVLNLLLGEDNICSPTYTEIIFWVSWRVCVYMYLQRLIFACIYVYSTYWMHASHMTILVQEHLYKSHTKTPNPHVHAYIYDPYLVLINILPIRMNKGLCRPGWDWDGIYLQQKLQAKAWHLYIQCIPIISVIRWLGTMPPHRTKCIMLLSHNPFAQLQVEVYIQ